ncbi:MAG: hypothetical protein GXO82_06530 [Chlorobi bacterium]|nr:hypothetical protein [Chlorobiota bacterium]
MYVSVRIGTGGVTNVAYYGEERAMYLLMGAQMRMVIRISSIETDFHFGYEILYQNPDARTIITPFIQLNTPYFGARFGVPFSSKYEGALFETFNLGLWLGNYRSFYVSMELNNYNVFLFGGRNVGLGFHFSEKQHEIWLGYVDLFFWTPYRDKTGFAVKTTWNIADSYSLLASATLIKGNTQFVSLGMHYKF